MARALYSIFGASIRHFRGLHIRSRQVSQHSSLWFQRFTWFQADSICVSLFACCLPNLFEKKGHLSLIRRNLSDPLRHRFQTPSSTVRWLLVVPLGICHRDLLGCLNFDFALVICSLFEFASTRVTVFVFDRTFQSSVVVLSRTQQPAIHFSMPHCSGSE